MGQAQRQTRTATAAATPRRVAIYLRQSLDAKDDRAAVLRQEKECRKWITARYPEAAIVDVFEDNDRSATRRGTVRPQFQRMLVEARQGQFDLVVSWHLDRLTRTLRDYLPLIELATEHGVGVTTVSGELDLTTDMGQTLAGILAVVANGEVKRKGARQVLANEQRAEQGRPTQGGRRAFGYQSDGLAVVRSEAEVIKKMYRSLLAGASLRSIAAELNAAGTRTGQGNTWTGHAVRLVLINPRNAAIHTRHGVETGRTAAWKPIVDETTYRAAVAKLADPTRRTNHSGGERRRLLTGVARCGPCDDSSTVTSGSRAGGNPLYVCKGPVKHLSRDAAAVEHFVTEAILERLGRPDAIGLLTDRHGPDTDALMAERLALLTRQDTAASEFAAGRFTAKQVADINKATTARIADIDAQLSDGRREQVLGDLVRADSREALERIWGGLSVARKQAVLAMLATITLDKGKVGGSPASRYRTPADYRVRIDWAAWAA